MLVTLYVKVNGRAWYDFYNRSIYTIVYDSINNSSINCIKKIVDLDINSSQMDSMLQLLGWTKETLVEFRRKLIAVNCNYILINRKGIDVHQFDIGANQNYCFIYDKNYLRKESILNLKEPVFHGNPIGNSEIGKRAIVR